MSKKVSFFALAVLCAFALGTYQMASAQDEASSDRVVQTPEVIPNVVDPALIYHPEGQVIVPESSMERPEDRGVAAHTNTLVFVPKGHMMASMNPDFNFAETPASLSCVYKVGPNFTGCNPLSGTLGHASGGWGAIALVDAYDNPNAAADFKTFNARWGLPAGSFTKVYANSSFGTLNGLNASCSGVPAADVGWGLEEDLDVQWAHAMAPAAKIILVEACSNSYNDLFYAEQVAAIKVTAAGGGDISNSWGGGENPSQLGSSGFDNYFYRYYYDHITYFASAGDSGWGAAYPSSNPWVVSAGGTTVNRDASGNFLNESCWAGSGGGVSAYEKWLSPPNIFQGMGMWTNYQYAMSGQSARQTPDIAFDADPASGVYVYDSFGYGGWVIVGGTSVSSPSLAGIINSANQRFGQTPPGGGYYNTEELNLLYSQLFAKTAYGVNFYDVTTGSNGAGHNAGVGYDQCTGIGSPRGKLGK